MEATITDLINASAYGQNGVPHELWTHLRKESPVYWYAQRGHTPFWAITKHEDIMEVSSQPDIFSNEAGGIIVLNEAQIQSFICLLYTSPSPRDDELSRMPSSA